MVFGWKRGSIVMKIGGKSKPSIKGGREFVAYIFPDALLETILNFNFITEEFHHF